MGPVKPVSGETALPPFKPAIVKGAAPVPAGAKPSLTVPAGNDPVLPKPQGFPFPVAAPIQSSPFPGLKARELYTHTAALLGLPQDTLSLALISAVRYFSLSPDAALLSRLRGNLLASGAASAPKTGREKAALEAKALAAAAAADKGLYLSPQALEEYVMDDAWFSGGGGREGRPEKEDVPDREETPEGEELEEWYVKANRSQEKGGGEGLLSWLNRLPGRDGQRWAVFPFKIKVKGVELKVFVRLLIKGHPAFASGRDAGQGSLIVDIEGPAQNRRFILEKRCGKSLLDITVYPAQAGDVKAIEKEAEKFFSGMEIRVYQSDEAPSLTDQLYQEALPSINEEV
jgi:hypothetical protein